MTNSVELVDSNPVVLVKDFQDKVLEGFYANTSIEGYPSLTTFPARVRLFAGDKPSKRIGIAETSDNIVIESYDHVNWLLDVQDLILQGFRLSVGSIVVGNLMACTMVREEAVVEAPKATVEEAKPVKAPRKNKSKEV